MILDGIYYPFIHFGRVILYVWSSPPVASLSPTCTLGGTYVLHVSPDATLSIISPKYNLSKTLSPSLWRGCINNTFSRFHRDNSVVAL